MTAGGARPGRWPLSWAVTAAAVVVRRAPWWCDGPEVVPYERVVRCDGSPGGAGRFRRVRCGAPLPGTAHGVPGAGRHGTAQPVGTAQRRHAGWGRQGTRPFVRPAARQPSGARRRLPTARTARPGRPERRPDHCTMRPPDHRPAARWSRPRPTPTRPAERRSVCRSAGRGHRKAPTGPSAAGGTRAGDGVPSRTVPRRPGRPGRLRARPVTPRRAVRAARDGPAPREAPDPVPDLRTASCAHGDADAAGAAGYRSGAGAAGELAVRSACMWSHPVRIVGGGPIVRQHSRSLLGG